MVARDQFIDSLRGFSIIVMILTHVTAFFPSDKLAFTLWNWSNFAVPIFIFCSVYLFFKKNSNQQIKLGSFYKKRFFRLLLPYYIFLIFFLSLLFFISPNILTGKYIWQSIFVIGGVDINWMVLLFLLITFLLPLLSWCQKKATSIFVMIFVLAFGSAIALLFTKIALPYKFIFWLPWLVIIFFTWFYTKFEENKKVVVLLFVGSGFVFLSTFVLQTILGQSVVLVHNKYPPNIYYLSYGLTILLGLYFCSNYLFQQKMILKIINFFSRHSYSIYFLHYFLLTFFATFIKALHFNWVILFLIVILLTFFLQFAFNTFIKRFDLTKV